MPEIGKLTSLRDNVESRTFVVDLGGEAAQIDNKYLYPVLALN